MVITAKETSLLWVNSADSLMNRLNNGSCQGVIKQSSTAGFHFLGEEDEEINGITNRLQIPFSSHFLEDQKRRQKYLAQLASEQDIDTFRPHSLFRSTTRQVNDPCIPDEWASHFTDPSSFSCPSDTSCSVVSRILPLAYSMDPVFQKKADKSRRILHRCCFVWRRFERRFVQST